MGCPPPPAVEPRKKIPASTYVYTVCLAIGHLASGIVLNLIWPSLVDLRFVYGANSSQMSYVATYLSSGALIGSLVGFLYKWINRQLTMAASVVVVAASIAMFPHCQSLAGFFICVIFTGIGCGTWECGLNIWIVELWPDHNGPMMQFSEFIYGLGTFIGPILVAPFVNGNANITVEERVTELTYPFAISGILHLIVAISVFVLFWTPIRYKKKQETEIDSIETSKSLSDTKPEDASGRKWKLVLILFSFSSYAAAQIVYLSFSPTMWQYVEIQLTATESAHVNSLLRGIYTASRLLTAFVALKVKPDTIIIYHFVIITISQLILFFGRFRVEVIYAGSALAGYGFSPMWPAMLSFIDRHIKLTNRVGSILYTTAFAVNIFAPIPAGFFLETKPLTLFGFTGGYLLFSLVFFLALKLTVLHKANIPKQTE